MNRVKLIIEYDGSNYVGWQKQKNGKSIQQEIESCLEKLFDETIPIYVSGRTDAGVHAFGQVAHFDINNPGIEISKIYSALNYLLKKSDNQIVILRSDKVSSLFDSRFSVKKKTYLYRIFNRTTPSSIFKNRVWFIPQKLNIEKMKQSSKVLIGNYDFSAFRSINCQAKNPQRSIKDIKIQKKKNLIEIRVIGKSFMHNQVRIIVGTLINSGLERWDKKEVKKILNSKDRKNAGPTAPAHGLYLEKIMY